MKKKVSQINDGITIKVHIKYCEKKTECKKRHICEKDYLWNPAPFNCENGKYLASIMDKIICDEIIDEKERKKKKNRKFLYFTYLFINHHYIIDSC